MVQLKQCLISILLLIQVTEVPLLWDLLDRRQKGKKLKDKLNAKVDALSNHFLALWKTVTPLPSNFMSKFNLGNEDFTEEKALK